MLINEVASTVSSSRLAALVNFLANRAKDENTKKEISGKAFINLAQSLGIPLTISQLKDISQQAPLSNLIADIQGSDNDPEDIKILFKPGPTEPNAMTVDQAKNTVDSMAKRAIDIK
jgi:hypothetical protein